MSRPTIAGHWIRLIACAGLAPALIASFGGGVAGAAPLPESSPLYSPSAPIVDENPEVRAEFAGTITREQKFEEGPEKEKTKATVKWKTSVQGPVDEIEYVGVYSPSIHWHVSELTGSVTHTASIPLESCEGTFSATGSDGGSGGVKIPLDEPGFPAGGGNPATNPDYEVKSPLGAPLSLLTSKSTGTSGPCETSAWNSAEPWLSPAGEEPEALKSVNPTIFFPPGGTFTQPLSFPGGCAPFCEKGETLTITVNSSLTFSSPGLPSPLVSGPTTGKGPERPFGPPELRDWLRASKEAAHNDIIPALENARNYCTPYALGLGGFGTGALLLGSGAVGGALVVSGSLTALAAEPFCIATVKRVAKDIKRYGDPPDPKIHTVARPATVKPGPLPSCGRWRGATLRFCKRLRGAEGSWMAAAEQAAAIDEALLTTTNRESTALAAGDSGAIALQRTAGLKLEAEETAALNAKNAAGRTMAELLRSAGIRFRLTRKQSKATIKAVEHALAKQGISASTLSSLGSPALKPGAVELLAGLSR